MGVPLKVLVIDDAEDDAVLLTRHICNTGYDVASDCIDNPAAMRDALMRAAPDIVFCDMRMPDFDPLAALNILNELASDVPFIAMSGVVAEDRLVETIRAGAYDFLRKDNFSRLGNIIDRALQEKRLREEKRTVETLLNESETRFKSLLEMLPDAVVIYDENGRIIFANDNARQLLRVSDDTDLAGKHFESFTDQNDLPELLARFKQVMETGDPVGVEEHTCIASDGTRIPVEATGARIQWSGKQGFLAILRDVTARYEGLARIRQTEARATAVLQNVADGVIIIDENSTIQTFNRAAEDMFGYASDDVVGANLSCLMPGEFADIHQSFVSRYAFSGVGRIIGKGGRELPGRHKNGTIFPTEISVSEVRVDGERLFIGALRDITERKKHEKTLGESEERFRRAFETAPHGMALVGLNGQWLQVNRAFCHMVGYSRDELLKTDFQTITHPDDVAADLEHVRRILSGEITTVELEKRYIRKDGAIIWILLCSSLIRDGDGGPLYFISQMIDITARKHAEEENQRLEQQIRHGQKLESIGTLSGGIAHEFNNMLLPICGLIELCLDEVQDRPEVTEALLKALGNANRAASLIDKILTFSRVDNCALMRTKIVSAVEEAVALLEATIPSTITIAAELNDIGEAIIDKTQISQIVMNFGVNAMHAIGPEVGRIEFKLETETVKRRRMLTSGPLLPGRYAKLSVKDTGCGMDEATIARIFEPFFTTKEVGKGTGMGLAFVHGVVENHGGVIDVKSRPGGGTTFLVFLPFERAERSLPYNPAAA